MGTHTVVNNVDVCIVRIRTLTFRWSRAVRRHRRKVLPRQPWFAATIARQPYQAMFVS